VDRGNCLTRKSAHFRLVSRHGMVCVRVGRREGRCQSGKKPVCFLALTRSPAYCLTGNSKQRVRRLQIATVQVWSYASHRVFDEEAFAPRGHPLEPRLEGNRVKVAGCPLGAVLRGGGRSNPVSLPDRSQQGYGTTSNKMQQSGEILETCSVGTTRMS